MPKMTLRKYIYDDNYSWAVFRYKDIKEIKGVILCGQATPLMSGCSKREAQYYKRQLESK